MKASAIAFWCGTLPAFVALLLVSCGAKGRQAAPGRTPPKSEGQAGRLSFRVGKEGLTALAYNGQALLPQPQNGMLRAAADPTFRRADGSVYTLPGGTPVTTVIDSAHKTVTVTYAWGAITCAYKGSADRIDFALSVRNSTHDTLTRLTVQLLEPVFPNVP